MSTSANATDSLCQGLAVNPDISGIGVRLSFYLQNFFLVILVTRSWEDAPGALWTFIATSFGLTIAAIGQARHRQLSFFQVLQVSNLVWMANFGTFLALASYSRLRAMDDKVRKERKKLKLDSEEGRTQETNSADNAKQILEDKEKKPKPDRVVKFFAMIQMYFSIGLTLYTWTHPDAFVNDDESCAPSIQYVAFFGATFPARGSGRKLGVSMITILAIVYTTITFYELGYSFRKRVKRRKQIIDVESGDLTRSHNPGNTVTRNQPSPGLPNMPLSATERQGKSKDKHNRQKRATKQPWGADLDPMFLMITLLALIIFVYFIVSTELLLKHNQAASGADAEWGFGQIFALVVVTPVLVSCFSALKEYGFRNRHHKKTKHK
ncbi:hypothetical protein C8Q75DRAFT_777173 [Abortiporus biennis]|nr:hypothetical protein C8Q75DRAFT_777173 [Abortiporus biennis]